jgi:hypothetical protein
MKRRRFLTTIAAGTTVAAAGCVGGPSDDGSDENGGSGTDGDTGNGSDAGNGTDTGNETGNGTDGGTGTPGLTVANAEFTVVASDCGQGTDDSTISYGANGVTIEGVASAPNPCYTARLVDAAYDAEADALTVTVESYLPEGEQDTVCAECVADVEYTASVSFEGGLPGRVAVTHGDREVATAEK